LPNRTTLAWACGALCLLSNPAFAIGATDETGAVQRLEREQLERMIQEQRLRQKFTKPEVSVPEAARPGAASEERNIPVTAFEWDASAILSGEEIRAVLQPYEGKTLSLADLFTAVAGINKLYADRNMPTAKAFLPPQDIRDGRVKVRLVEARVGEIKVGPVKQVSPDFVRERLSLSSGDLVSVSRLESDLLRFNRLHEVQLRARVEAGKRSGETDLLIDAAEPKRYQYSVFADNAGRYSVGEERIGFSARVAGLSGRGDNLQFSATGADGSRSYSLAYSVPLTPRDLKLDLAYSQGDIKVVEGSFVPLDVSGVSQEFSVGLSYPLLVEGRPFWNFYGRVASKESVSEFGGAEQQNQDLAVLTLGASGEQQSETASWNLDMHLSQGMLDFGGESSFTALRVNAAWLGTLSPRSQLLLRGGLQLSPTDLLPAAEQFQLGGSASVRGYSEGLLSGRQGYLMSLEWRYALQNPEEYLTRDPNTPLTSAMVFLDHGGAFPFRPAPQSDVTYDDMLTGAGVGLVFDWKEKFSGRLAVAWPLRDNPGEIEPREPRLHVSIAYKWP